MLHISDFKKYDRCERLFWLHSKERKDFIPFINYNENMITLCKTLLMITDPFEGARNDDGALALAALQTHEWLLNARFVYGELRVKVPILLQAEGKRIIYFTFVNCYPKEHEARTIADTLSVLEKLGINIDEVYAIHLNAEYVRAESLDVRELLIINECLFNAKNKAHKKIDKLVASYKRDIDEEIALLQACVMKEELIAVRRSNCTKGSKCSYYDTCFPTMLSNTSILNLVQSAKKYEMLERGILDIKDVDVDCIEGSRHQYAQIMAARNGIYIDKAAIRCWIKLHISYPISYLDFEWETFAYPPYSGMKAFDVLTFQYSLHVEAQPDTKLSHVSFISSGDCRIAFIEHLLSHIPTTGSILVYNMEGAEKLRLMQLASQFPQYEEQLKAVWERMIDLSLPFSSGNIYDNRMAGLYSLKALVPIFSDYSYEDLAISYGMDAVEHWRKLEGADEQERATILHDLEEYCAMDTYAEYIVYHAILDLIEA